MAALVLNIASLVSRAGEEPGLRPDKQDGNVKIPDPLIRILTHPWLLDFIFLRWTNIIFAFFDEVTDVSIQRRKHLPERSCRLALDFLETISCFV